MINEQVIQQILLKSTLYEDEHIKSERGKNCQFFTPYNVGMYMSGLFEIKGKETLKILDPCGGTGILDLCILDIATKTSSIKKICIDVYEIDPLITKTLRQNLRIIKEALKNSDIELRVKVIRDNYIVRNDSFWNKQENGKYDIVIGNPPYKKISKNDTEAIIMRKIVYGQPNLYMLFMALSVLHLDENGQLVYLIPRSFCNGLYFKEFRRWLKKNCYISHIHSFHDRSKIINDEVLQELIIIKIVKKEIENITISHSKSNVDITDSKNTILPRKVIWENLEPSRIRLPLLEGDEDILNRFGKLIVKLKDLGISFSTGPVVDFRVANGLYSEQVDNVVPVIWSSHFTDFKIEWPINKKKGLQQYIARSGNEKKLLEIKNYILVKRFKSKEEYGLGVNLLWGDELCFDKIGIENHVNYASCDDIAIFKGTYILLKSGLYNRYFKIINGTTQINVSDLNELPVPSIKIMKDIGNSVNIEDLGLQSSECCDKILAEYI